MTDPNFCFNFTKCQNKIEQCIIDYSQITYVGLGITPQTQNLFFAESWDLKSSDSFESPIYLELS